MKEKDLSLIKRYSIVEYLEKKRHQACPQNTNLCCVSLTIEGRSASEFQGGQGKEPLDRLCRRQGWKYHRPLYALGRLHALGSHLPFGQNASEYIVPSSSSPKRETSISPKQTENTMASGTRRLTSISDTLPPHLQEYLKKERCIDLEKATPFLKCISYEVRGRRHETIGFANSSGGYELRDNKIFKGTIAPKDITPIFEDRAQPVCLFEGFMDFLSFLSMKGEVTNQCLVMNSVSNVARSIHYLNKRNITSVRAFLDNDDTGRKAVQEFVNAGFKVEDMAVYYKDFKDLNEYHVSRVREHEKSQNTSNKIKQVKLKIR